MMYSHSRPMTARNVRKYKSSTDAVPEKEFRPGGDPKVEDDEAVALH